MQHKLMTFVTSGDVSNMVLWVAGGASNMRGTSRENQQQLLLIGFSALVQINWKLMARYTDWIRITLPNEVILCV